MGFLARLAQFLEEEAGEIEEEASSCENGTVVMYVFIGVIIVALIAIMVVSSRRNKKRQKESENLIAAVRPGNKVKTIGGICGIVVEVDDEESTFVLETGSEETGKFYIKFDKQAIYQTDAVPESTNPDDNLIPMDDSGSGDEQPLEEDPYAGLDQIFGSGDVALPSEDEKKSDSEE